MSGGALKSFDDEFAEASSGGFDQEFSAAAAREPDAIDHLAGQRKVELPEMTITADQPPSALEEIADSAMKFGKGVYMGATHSATAGLDDDLAGLVGGDAGRQAAVDRLWRAHDDSPIGYAVGDVAGNFLLPVGAALKGASALLPAGLAARLIPGAGKSLIGAAATPGRDIAARAAAEGFIGGGARAFGDGDPDQSVGERAINALPEASASGVAGGVLTGAPVGAMNMRATRAAANAAGAAERAAELEARRGDQRFQSFGMNSSEINKLPTEKRASLLSHADDLADKAGRLPTEENLARQARLSVDEHMSAKDALADQLDELGARVDPREIGRYVQGRKYNYSSRLPESSDQRDGLQAVAQRYMDAPQDERITNIVRPVDAEPVPKPPPLPGAEGTPVEVVPPAPPPRSSARYAPPEPPPPPPPPRPSARYAPPEAAAAPVETPPGDAVEALAAERRPSARYQPPRPSARYAPPPAEDPTYYYHTTPAENLPGIQQQGLVPGSAPSPFGSNPEAPNQLFFADDAARNDWAFSVAEAANEQAASAARAAGQQVPGTQDVVTLRTKLPMDAYRTDVPRGAPEYTRGAPVPPQDLEYVGPYPVDLQGFEAQVPSSGWRPAATQRGPVMASEAASLGQGGPMPPGAAGQVLPPDLPPPLRGVAGPPEIQSELNGIPFREVNGERKLVGKRLGLHAPASPENETTRAAYAAINRAMEQGANRTAPTLGTQWADANRAEGLSRTLMDSSSRERIRGSNESGFPWLSTAAATMVSPKLGAARLAGWGVGKAMEGREHSIRAAVLGYQRDRALKQAASGAAANSSASAYNALSNQVSGLGAVGVGPGSNAVNGSGVNDARRAGDESRGFNLADQLDRELERNPRAFGPYAQPLMAAKSGAERVAMAERFRARDQQFARLLQQIRIQ